MSQQVDELLKGPVEGLKGFFSQYGQVHFGRP